MNYRKWFISSVRELHVKLRVRQVQVPLVLVPWEEGGGLWSSPPIPELEVRRFPFSFTGWEEEEGPARSSSFTRKGRIVGRDQSL